MFEEPQDDRFRALSRKILELAPAPMGFARPAEKAG